MNILASLVVAAAIVLFAGCSTTQSANTETKLTAAVSLDMISVDTLVAYKEISGFWLSTTTGQLSDFYLKDVRISGQIFTAVFFLKSTGRLSCSVDEKVNGTYIEGVFKWELKGDVSCIKSWHYQGTITTSSNISDWRGAYFVPGRRPSYGWYIIKNVIE